MSPPDPVAEKLRAALTRRVGGFFHNARKDLGVACQVCAGPATEAVCGKCAGHRDEFGDRLANQVAILAYARGYAPGLHQSAHHVREYKAIPPAEKCAEDLAMMILAATYIHWRCIAGQGSGAIWDSVTFVPSKSRPGPEHPVAELARNVALCNGSKNRFRLHLGVGYDAPKRTIVRDRFSVPESALGRVVGKRILLVDDTWTTGGTVQSAAVALHDAGAGHVTALCVARWCRHDWSDHRQLLDSCTAPYDAFVCPVQNPSCAVAASGTGI